MIRCCEAARCDARAVRVAVTRCGRGHCRDLDVCTSHIRLMGANLAYCVACQTEGRDTLLTLDDSHPIPLRRMSGAAAGPP